MAYRCSKLSLTTLWTNNKTRTGKRCENGKRCEKTPPHPQTCSAHGEGAVALKWSSHLGYWSFPEWCSCLHQIQQHHNHGTNTLISLSVQCFSIMLHHKQLMHIKPTWKATNIFSSRMNKGEQMECRNMTRSCNRGLKSLEADTTGKEVRDNRCVLRLTPSSTDHNFLICQDIVCFIA